MFSLDEVTRHQRLKGRVKEDRPTDPRVGAVRRGIACETFNVCPIIISFIRSGFDKT